MDDTTRISRKMGKCPDRFYAQLNGKTAQENYEEQKQQILENTSKTKIIIDEKELEKTIVEAIDKILSSL